MDKVSIIVPVYNAERYLVKCVESILNQTYENIELILVDDGSTDSSAQLCKSFTEKDIRTKYYYQKNMGVSVARNTGIVMSSGEYICFVDSDDQLDSKAIELMIELMISKNNDLIVAGYVKDFGTHKEIISINDTYIDSAQVVLTYFEKHFREGIASSVWGKLYKKKLITSLFDESMTMGEDLVFNINYFSRISTLSAIDYPAYIYNQTNMASLVHNISVNKYKQTIRACEEMINWLNTCGYKAQEYNNAYHKIVDHLYSFVVEISNGKGNVKSITKVLDELRGLEIIDKAVNFSICHFNAYQRLILKLFYNRKYAICITLSKINSFFSRVRSEMHG